MGKVFGGVLMGCGILMAGVFGLCTLLVSVTALLDTSTQDAREFASMIPAVLIFGGIPVGLGVLMVYLGRRLIRQAGESPDSATDKTDVFN